MAWVEIYEPNAPCKKPSYLLCRYDPERGLLEFVKRRVPMYVDLRAYRSSKEPSPLQALADLMSGNVPPTGELAAARARYRQALTRLQDAIQTLNEAEQAVSQAMSE